jgi:hypothetical protein
LAKIPMCNCTTRMVRRAMCITSGTRSRGGARLARVVSSAKAVRMGFKAACTAWTVTSGVAAADTGGRRSWKSRRFTPDGVVALAHISTIP